MHAGPSSEHAEVTAQERRPGKARHEAQVSWNSPEGAGEGLLSSTTPVGQGLQLRAAPSPEGGSILWGHRTRTQRAQGLQASKSHEQDETWGQGVSGGGTGMPSSSSGDSSRSWPLALCLCPAPRAGVPLDKEPNVLRSGLPTPEQPHSPAGSGALNVAGKHPQRGTLRHRPRTLPKVIRAQAVRPQRSQVLAHPDPEGEGPLTQGPLV